MMESTTSSSSTTTRSCTVSSSSSSSSSGGSWNNYSSMYKQPPYYNHCYPYYNPLQPAMQFSAGAAQPMAVGPNGAVLGVLLSKEQEKRLVTKVARCKRKLARQRSQLNFSRSSTTSFNNNISSSSSSCRPISSTGIGFSQRDSTTRKVSVSVSGSQSSDSQNDRKISINRDLYTFFTPDNKRLRALLKKELKNSDVGSLGRIVLPKREAEEKLPTLSDKEGIQISVRDVYSHQGWSLRYKYWLNNKSRMYVLENTGDFVKQNGLEIGDSITLYEDECKNLYVSIKKGAADRQVDLIANQNTNDNNSPASDDTEYSSSKSTEETNDNLYANFACELYKEYEDESSLALLIEQLNHKELHEANNLVDFSPHMDVSSSSSHHARGHLGEAAKCGHNLSLQHDHNDIVTTGGGISTQSLLSMSTPGADVKAADDHFEDCYGGLGTLPEVDQCRYYSYANLFDGY